MKRRSGAQRRKRAKERRKREAAEENQRKFIEQAMASSEGRKEGKW